MAVLQQQEEQQQLQYYFRTDSTLVAPYERWQYYNENVRELEQGYNVAENKTKQVAWFVSNCGAR